MNVGNFCRSNQASGFSSIHFANRICESNCVDCEDSDPCSSKKRCKNKLAKNGC